MWDRRPRLSSAVPKAFFRSLPGLIFWSGALWAQQPILYTHGAVNAASLAPFGLPNGPIAPGSVFQVAGENLGPSQSQAVSSYPLATQLAGVSLRVIQKGVATPAFPISVSATQIYAVMPSTVSVGLATLRLTRQNSQSNAITIQIASSAPGLFAISGGGYGPGVIQNNLPMDDSSSDAGAVINIGGYGAGILPDSLLTDDPSINSSANPAAPRQSVTIWATGLGAIPDGDNAPSGDSAAAPVTVTIGGVSAAVTSSGRAECCAGVDQIVVTIPDSVPLGCWVPVSVNAGGAVSNTATLAIAATGATSCSDPANPFSQLVLTSGTQALIGLTHLDLVQNIDTATPSAKSVDQLYSRFYTQPSSPYNFDPYLSYPPPGACLVHQAAGDASVNFTLRGALAASASLDPQPNQTYNNGTQSLMLPAAEPLYANTMGGTIDATAFGMNLATSAASLTVDPGGPNETVLALSPAPPPVWARPKAILAIPRNAPLALAFTPGDPNAPTAILLYAFSSATNSTVEVQCLAPAGASALTISADTLANLPSSSGTVDGSYAELMIGNPGLNTVLSFTNGLAAMGTVFNSSWVGQSVALQ